MAYALSWGRDGHTHVHVVCMLYVWNVINHQRDFMRHKHRCFILFGNRGPVIGCCLKISFERMALTVVVWCVTFSSAWLCTGHYVCE